MFEAHIKNLARKQISLVANCYTLMDFKPLYAPLQALFCEDIGRKGYHVESGVAAPALQWMENLSARELGQFLRRK